jgi:hypothetical protein
MFKLATLKNGKEEKRWIFMIYGAPNNVLLAAKELMREREITSVESRNK